MEGMFCGFLQTAEPHVVTCGDTVVLGHVSGGVTLLKFDFTEIDTCVG